MEDFLCSTFSCMLLEENNLIGLPEFEILLSLNFKIKVTHNHLSLIRL